MLLLLAERPFVCAAVGLVWLSLFMVRDGESGDGESMLRVEDVLAKGTIEELEVGA